MSNLNFQTLEAYDVDIENFTYDVSDLVDSIFVGPQGELLELIEQFNNNYNTKIGVTKSFTLKPGGYDEIKKAHSGWVLRYDMKPRGIKSIFDRMEQYRWRLSNFKNELTSIDTRMKSLKQSGMRWQDNTDQFEEEFDKLKLSIINSLEQTREMYPNIEISCKIIPVSQNRLDYTRGRNYYNELQSFPTSIFAENAVDFLLVFYLELNNTEMNVHVMDEDSRIDQYRLAMGDIVIASGTYLLPMISRNWGRATPMTGNVPSGSYSYFLEALYIDEMRKSFHPYIRETMDKYSWKLNDDAHAGNVCTGNMGSDLRNSLINNEIMAHIVNLVTWVTNYYVPQTNPLNRISKARYFGDDIQFALWRSDLNSSSERVFSYNDSDRLLPFDCGFSDSLNSTIVSYGCNTLNVRGYRHNASTYNRNDQEYKNRVEDYINTIDVSDMPCNNCSYKSDCKQWLSLQLIFGDELSPTEEAYIGMLYELYDVELNAIRPVEGSCQDIAFVEEALEQAWRTDTRKQYDKLVKCFQMVKEWFHINDGDMTPINFQRSISYRRRMRALWNMNSSNRDHLYNTHYNNQDSEFIWSLDSINSYTDSEPTNETFSDTLANDEVMQSWLRTTDTDDLPMPFADSGNGPIQGDREQEDIVEEELTPEQRTIQWAIQNGGANNL